VADHPLRPANHRSLGRPLPHLLANGTQTPLRAVAYSEATFPCKTYEKQEYPVLVPLSAYYSRREDRLSTRYSPVRHFTQDRSPFRVRLACVKHAASVRSEPGSNSPVNILASHYDWTFLSKSKKLLGPLIYCSVFKDQNPASARMCHAVFAASRHYNSSSLTVSRINSWGKSSCRPSCNQLAPSKQREAKIQKRVVDVNLFFVSLFCTQLSVDFFELLVFFHDII
jgi:hypothetical protein